MKHVSVRRSLAAVVLFAAACSNDDSILAPPTPVASVTVQSSSSSIFEEDTVQLRARVQDAAGNELEGRTVTWASSDPGIVLVTESGAAIARKPGSATITAASGGRSATLALVVQPRPRTSSRYVLESVDGNALPLTVDSAQVLWNEVLETHVVRMEQGAFELSGTPLRYQLAAVYREYRVVTQGGQSYLEPLLTFAESDRGLATWGAGGALSLLSEVVYPLSHTAQRQGPTLQVDYRIPGDDVRLHLSFREAP